MNRNAVRPKIWVDDIVWSVWKHTVGVKPNTRVTNLYKHKRSEYNTVLWNSGIEANKEIARKQKRRLKYIANILVISDPKNPDNEGKVFLYRFGSKIFDKINEAMNPQFQDEKPFNPFDFWAGANFKLKIRKVEGYQNYDKSEFESPAPLFDGEDTKLEKIWKAEHSLKEFLDPKNFKSYDELKAKLNRVLGVEASSTSNANRNSKAESSKPASKTEEPSWDSSDSDDDDEMKYFSKLASDD